MTASAGAGRATEAERDATLARPRRQPARGQQGAGWISRDDAARRRHDGVRRGPRGSDQDAGGAGPGLCPDSARPRCARIFRITAGSCSVAIRRSRPPQRGHARTSTANHRRRRGRGLRHHAPVRDHTRAPAGARGQQTMAHQQVRLRPRDDSFIMPLLRYQSVRATPMNLWPTSSFPLRLLRRRPTTDGRGRPRRGGLCD